MNVQGIFCPSLGAIFRPPFPMENSHLFPISVFAQLKKVKKDFFFFLNLFLETTTTYEKQ